MNVYVSVSLMFSLEHPSFVFSIFFDSTFRLAPTWRALSRRSSFFGGQSIWEALEAGPFPAPPLLSLLLFSYTPQRGIFFFSPGRRCPHRKTGGMMDMSMPGGVARDMINTDIIIITTIVVAAPLGTVLDPHVGRNTLAHPSTDVGRMTALPSKEGMPRNQENRKNPNKIMNYVQLWML